MRRVSLGELTPIFPMKPSLHLTTLVCIAFGAVSLSAQIGGPQPNAPVPARRNNFPQNAQVKATGSETTRFDLDFPGGTPGELAAAISKATGKHLNLIIPEAHQAAKIMPIKVVNVTVSEVFTAIAQASQRQMPVVTGSRGEGRNVQYQNIALTFLPVSGEATDETVWAFQSSEPTAEAAATMARLSEPELVCEYFQLAPYLEAHTIEDITTAVETGWKMLGIEPMPKLSFHQETKLLIAVGAAEQVQQNPGGAAAAPARIRVRRRRKSRSAMAEVAALTEAKAPGWEKKKVEEI